MQGTLEMGARFRLQELLDAAVMSQSELARQSGVSLVTVNKIAQNRSNQVSLKTLDALSSVLKCQPGDLLEREPKRKGK
jgi:putative transcriptional regulator